MPLTKLCESDGSDKEIAEEPRPETVLEVEVVRYLKFTSTLS